MQFQFKSSWMNKKIFREVKASVDILCLEINYSCLYIYYLTQIGAFVAFTCLKSEVQLLVCHIVYITSACPDKIPKWGGFSPFYSEPEVKLNVWSFDFITFHNQARWEREGEEAELSKRFNRHTGLYHKVFSTSDRSAADNLSAGIITGTASFPY